MNWMVRRVGILGGTFDPIHQGHLDLAGAAATTLALTEMVIVTSNVPPHRPQPAASSFHRFAMVAFAIQEHRNWRASDLELRHAAPSYTSRTLNRFHDRGYEPKELFFVIGADAFLEIASWRDYPNILESAHFVVVSRPGMRVGELPQRLPQLAPRMAPEPLDALSSELPLIVLIDALTADVSSTAIRSRLAERESIAGLVPASVRQHIEQHGLYAPATPGRRASDISRMPEAGGSHGKD